MSNCEKCSGLLVLEIIDGEEGRIAQDYCLNCGKRSHETARIQRYASRDVDAILEQIKEEERKRRQRYIEREEQRRLYPPKRGRRRKIQVEEQSDRGRDTKLINYKFKAEQVSLYRSHADTLQVPEKRGVDDAPAPEHGARRRHRARKNYSGNRTLQLLEECNTRLKMLGFNGTFGP